ncbi:transposable element Tcb2 transposase [Trichonephila clavipes]|nr:transposable element Tcb2 transposase [Trichonephila clavipes]
MKLLRAVYTRRYPRAKNRVWSDQEDHEERGSMDRAASTCGPHSDSFNDTSRRASATASTVVPSQINAECHRLAKSWQKYRFVLDTNDNRVRVWRRPGERYNPPHTVLRHTARTADSSMDGPLPDLSPVENVWDQLIRPMPSCPSSHDLELAVQDLWAHLPQDNIRCLINSMSDRVSDCFAAGGGQRAIEVPSICVVAHPIFV